MKLTWLIGLFFLMFNYSVYGQKTIKGKVISENIETLPEVRIQDSDTVHLGKTDLDGNFEITLAQEADTLIFSWIGMEWLTVSVPKDCHYLEIIMLHDATYDWMSLRKVDRRRMKRFKKLPELHLSAFNKGFFKAVKPCFKREFEPYRSAYTKSKK